MHAPTGTCGREPAVGTRANGRTNKRLAFPTRSGHEPAQSGVMRLLRALALLAALGALAVEAAAKKKSTKKPTSVAPTSAAPTVSFGSGVF